MHVIHEGPDRWVAFDGDREVAAGAAFVRPDQRLFLRCVGDDPAAYAALADAVIAHDERDVHITVDATDAALVAGLRTAGLEEEYRGEGFRIRFDLALERLRRARLPGGYGIAPADTVDVDQLYDLDNTLRHLTPGTDGWTGNRDWFDDELAESPPFDPDGYLVATAPDGSLAGLIRIWRNPDEPSLGLVGVLPEHRHTTIAAELLRRALTAASIWGSETFTAATTPANRVIHPRMSRLRAEPLRSTVRFVRRARV